MNHAWYETIETPLGELFIGGSAVGLHRVDFLRDGRDLSWCIARLEEEAPTAPPAMRDPDSARRAAGQLREYFEGQRTEFDLRLAPVGTPFQLSVWEALESIPAGATDSYGAIAARLGQGSASRAVGAAVGRNPISIIVPCHRVIGSNGQLTGYAGGLERKRWLLDHEAVAMPLFARAS